MAFCRLNLPRFMLTDCIPAFFQKPHIHGCCCSCWSQGDTQLWDIPVQGQYILKHFKASMCTFWMNINNTSGTASQCQFSFGAPNFLLFTNTAFLNHTCYLHRLLFVAYLSLPAIQFSGSELAHFSSLTTYVQLSVAFPKLLPLAVLFANECVSPMWNFTTEKGGGEEGRPKLQLK